MLKYSTILKNEAITSIAIGGFDGLHRAHQVLLSHLDENGALVIVDKGFSPSLTPFKERCKYTNHPCLFLDFAAIKDMEAEAFIAYLRTTFPSLRKIVVGYDFRFGKERKGDPAFLAKESGLEVVVVEEQKLGDVSIHAEEIRALIQKGAIKEANKLLGRTYTLWGEVVSGQGIGKKALYPTFNTIVEDFILPKEGVYITQAVIVDKVYPALTFIGKRLSTDQAFSIETHVLESLEDEETKILQIGFLAYLRQNRKFDSLASLKEQITSDIAAAKGYFQGTT